MDTAVVNVKVDKKIKAQAQEVAKNLGFTLSALVNAYLIELVKTRKVSFQESYEPTPYLEEILRQSEEDSKLGLVSPSFDNVEDAIKWLNDPDAVYENQTRKNF